MRITSQTITIEVVHEDLDAVTSRAIWAHQVTVASEDGGHTDVEVRVDWREIATLFAACGDMAAREVHALRYEVENLRRELAKSREEGAS